MPSQVLNLKTKRWSGQEISISDHEAISTTLKLNNKHQNHDWIKQLYLCQKLLFNKNVDDWQNNSDRVGL